MCLFTAYEQVTVAFGLCLLGGVIMIFIGLGVVDIVRRGIFFAFSVFVIVSV